MAEPSTENITDDIIKRVNQENKIVFDNFGVNYESILEELIKHMKDFVLEPEITKKCVLITIQKLRLIQVLEDDKNIKLIRTSLIVMATCLSESDKHLVAKVFSILVVWGGSTIQENYKIMFMFIMNGKSKELKCLIQPIILEAFFPYIKVNELRLFHMGSAVFQFITKNNLTNFKFLKMVYDHFDHHLFTSLTQSFLRKKEYIQYINIWNFIISRKEIETQQSPKSLDMMSNEFDDELIEKNKLFYLDVSKENNNPIEIKNKYNTIKNKDCIYLMQLRDSKITNFTIHDFTQATNKDIDNYLRNLINPCDTTKKLFKFEWFEKYGKVEQCYDIESI